MNDSMRKVEGEWNIWSCVFGRRKAVGAHSSQEFFDHENEENIRVRQQCAQEAMDDLKKWMISEEKVRCGWMY